MGLVSRCPWLRVPSHQARSTQAGTDTPWHCLSITAMDVPCQRHSELRLDRCGGAGGSHRGISYDRRAIIMMPVAVIRLRSAERVDVSWQLSAHVTPVHSLVIADRRRTLTMITVVVCFIFSLCVRISSISRCSGYDRYASQVGNIEINITHYAIEYWIQHYSILHVILINSSTI